jgi:hypothetical protein
MSKEKVSIVFGECGSLNPGIPSSRHLWAAQAKMWLSHRNVEPAQEADALEPKGIG